MNQFSKASKRRWNLSAVFAVFVLAGCLLAIKVSVHPGIWIAALMASVPIFAAMVGGLPDKNSPGRN